MNKKRKSSLKQDMKKLAKHIYDISQSHGGIYISAACCGDKSDPGMVTYDCNERLENTYYFAKTEIEKAQA